MDKRKTAQDIAMEGNIFTKSTMRRVTFDEYYPQIADIEVKLYETGKNTHGHEITLHKGRLAVYINCSNRDCSEGGFEIDRVLTEMIRNEQTSREISLSCVGSETSPGGRKVYRRCGNEGHFTIEIKFKEKLV